MNIAVFSDTHGVVNHVIKTVNEMGQFDAIIHAGDYYIDARKLSSILKVPVYAVVGNCDEFEDGPEELMVTLGGCKIFITHGHLFRVKTTLEPLLYRSKELSADVVVFGHNHMPLNIWENNLLLFNPGSPTRPAGGFKACFGVLAIDAGPKNIKAEIFPID